MEKDHEGSRFGIYKKTRFTNAGYTENGYVATTVNANNKRLVFYNPEGQKKYTTGEYPFFGKELTVIEKI